ncbi:hypothetical protein G9A89_022990 [Geosiphon pyriformis]|nr:hypothetical protein G9A89_022990 [Geosiphon pyriformis]
MSKLINLIFLIFSLLAFVSLIESYPGLKKKYNKLVVFGDSFSDAGNAAKIAPTGFLTESDYQGRPSNGPIWAEYLGGFLGAEIDIFAYIGATTDSDVIQGYIPDETNSTRVNIPGIAQQVDSYKETVKPGDDLNKTLVVSWGPILTDYLYTNFTAEPEQVVQRIAKTWSTLYKIGVRNFLVPSVPNLSATPAFKLGRPELADTFFQIYLKQNEFLENAITDFKSTNPDVKVYTADYNKFVTNTTAAEKYGGITEFESACLNRAARPKVPACNNPEDYLYWDGVHLTTKPQLGLSFYFAKALTNEE